MRLSTSDSEVAANLVYWSLYDIVRSGKVARSCVPPEVWEHIPNPTLDMNSCCPRSSPIEACMYRLTVADERMPYRAWKKLCARFQRRRAGSDLTCTTAHAELTSGLKFWLTTVFSDGILSRRTFDFVAVAIGDDS